MRRALASVAHFRPNRRDLPVLLIVAMSLLGTAHILVRTWTYGAGIQYDSVLFLSIAENLAAGEGFKTFWGEEFVIGAPFFPAFLALISLTGIDPEEAGRLVNAVAFGMVILVSGLWLRRTLASPILPVLGALVILVSYPLNDRFSQIMTEPIFILFVVLSLIFIEAFINRDSSLGILITASAFSALCAVTRYPGIVVIGVGIILLLLLPRGKTVSVRLRNTAIFGAISSIPLAIVLVRNRIASGTLAGHTGDLASQSTQSVKDAFGAIVSVFDSWIILENMSQIPAWTIYSFLTVSVVLSFAIVLRKGIQCRYYCLPYVLFIILYLLFIGTVSPSVSPQNVDERYVLPSLIPAVLVAMIILDKSIRTDSVMAIRMTGYSLVSVCTIFYLFFAIELNISNTSLALKQGYSGQLYNTSYWTGSETLEYLKNFPPNRILYSPAFELLWYKSKESSSTYRHYWLDETLETLVNQMENRPGYSVYLVLIDGDNLARADYEDTARFLPGIEVIGEFSDGSIYRFPAGWRFDEDGYRANITRYLNELTGESGERVASAEFDVFVNGRTLVYIREPCVPADTEAWFFVHIDPDDPADLPEERRQWGFDGLDFIFDRQATWFGEKCLTTLDLPDYGIAAIRTGQYDDTGQLWNVEFAFPDQGESSPPSR